MKRLKSLIVFLSLLSFSIACDKIEDLQKVSRDLDEYIHSDSGTAKLQGYQFGTFYTSEDIQKHSEYYKGAYTFIAFKDEEQFAEIKKLIDYDLPVSFSDSTNTLEIMSGESYEDAREKQLSRIVEVFIKTDPMDANFDWIKLESSDSTLVRPEIISAKHYRLYLYDLGQVTLKVSVCVNGEVVTTKYPMTVFCSPTISFDAHSFWIYEDLYDEIGRYAGTKPRQLYTVGCRVTELPYNYAQLPYLAKMRMKVFRRCEYQNEVESGSSKFVKIDTIDIAPTQFVGRLQFGHRHNILHSWTTDFAHCYEEGYNYVTEEVNGETKRRIVKQYYPYAIEEVDLIFDATTFSPFFDFGGEISEQEVHIITNNSWADSTKRKNFEDFVNKVTSYDDYSIDLKAFDANEQNQEILDLMFNEFLSDKQLDSLRHVQRESFDSHGWTMEQVDSLWQANQNF